MAEKIWTPPEVAKQLSIHVETVRDYLREEKIKGFKLGRVWRVRDSDLQAFINAQTANPTPLQQENQNNRG